jgi:hypothetical protein
MEDQLKHPSIPLQCALVAALTLVLTLTACKPCGCGDADLDDAAAKLLGDGLTSAHMHFESPLIGEDRFTLEETFVNPPPGLPNPFIVRGSYKETSDSITFRPEGGTGLGIVGGARYTLKCEKDPKGLSFYRSGPTGQPLEAPRKFICKR